MTSFRPHASPDDEDALDAALERLVRGDRQGIDGLDPEMRATVDQMYRWADESGFRDEPLPVTPRRAWGGARWGPLASGLAAALLVGIIVGATFLIINLRQDDSAPESFYGSGGGDMADGDGDVNLTQGEYAQAIKVAYRDYRWPDDYTPAVNDIVNYFSTAEDRKESTVEYPYGPEPGHNVVGFWHSCAWYRAWLDAYQSGNVELEAEALDMITNVIPDHFNFHESTREGYTDAARRASLGDPSLVSKLLERCGDLPVVSDSEDNSSRRLDETLGGRLGELGLIDERNCFEAGPSGEMTPCDADAPPASED